MSALAFLSGALYVVRNAVTHWLSPWPLHMRHDGGKPSCLTIRVMTWRRRRELRKYYERMGWR